MIWLSHDLLGIKQSRGFIGGRRRFRFRCLCKGGPRTGWCVIRRRVERSYWHLTFDRTFLRVTTWKPNCEYFRVTEREVADIRSKLKVPELKALLSKHELPQTGKKDDLVKRLVENNISAEGGDDELVW